MTQAISSSAPHMPLDSPDFETDIEAHAPLSENNQVEKTTWAGGKIIHSIHSEGKKAYVVIEPYGRLGRPVFELKSKGKVIAQAYSPGYGKHLIDSWCLNIYDGKGVLLARLLPQSGSFGLARTLNIASPEGTLIAHSNLFSKRGAENIKFMCPEQTEELFSLSIDRSQKDPKWDLHISANSHIDPRIVRLVAAVISHNTDAEFYADKHPGLTPMRVIKPIGKYATVGIIVLIVLSKALLS